MNPAWRLVRSGPLRDRSVTLIEKSEALGRELYAEPECSTFAGAHAFFCGRGLRSARSTQTGDAVLLESTSGHFVQRLESVSLISIDSVAAWACSNCLRNPKTSALHVSTSAGRCTTRTAIAIFGRPPFGATEDRVRRRSGRNGLVS